MFVYLRVVDGDRSRPGSGRDSTQRFKRLDDSPTQGGAEWLGQDVEERKGSHQRHRRHHVDATGPVSGGGHADVVVDDGEAVLALEAELARRLEPADPQAGAPHQAQVRLELRPRDPPRTRADPLDAPEGPMRAGSGGPPGPRTPDPRAGRCLRFPVTRGTSGRSPSGSIDQTIMPVTLVCKLHAHRMIVRTESSRSTKRNRPSSHAATSHPSATPKASPPPTAATFWSGFKR